MASLTGFVPTDSPKASRMPEDRQWRPSTERSEGVGVPDGIRTRVTALKGRRPRPLDDRDICAWRLPGRSCSHNPERRRLVEHRMLTRARSPLALLCCDAVA